MQVKYKYIKSICFTLVINIEYQNEKLWILKKKITVCVYLLYLITKNYISAIIMQNIFNVVKC